MLLVKGGDSVGEQQILVKKSILRNDVCMLYETDINRDHLNFLIPQVILHIIDYVHVSWACH